MIGKEFPEPVLRPVVELEGSELEEALRELVAGEFVYELELYPGGDLRVQAPAHPGGGVQIAARRTAGGGARRGRARDRRAQPRPARRARGAPRAALGGCRRRPGGGALARAGRDVERDERSGAVADALAQGAGAGGFRSGGPGDHEARAHGEKPPPPVRLAPRDLVRGGGRPVRRRRTPGGEVGRHARTRDPPRQLRPDQGHQRRRSQGRGGPDAPGDRARRGVRRPRAVHGHGRRKRVRPVLHRRVPRVPCHARSRARALGGRPNAGRRRDHRVPRGLLPRVQGACPRRDGAT